MDRFDKDAFIGAYTDAARTQAAVIAGAFETMEQRFDARFDRIDRVLERAFPDEYAEAVNGGADRG